MREQDLSSSKGFEMEAAWILPVAEMVFVSWWAYAVDWKKLKAWMKVIFEHVGKDDDWREFTITEHSSEGVARSSGSWAAFEERQCLLSFFPLYKGLVITKVTVNANFVLFEHLPVLIMCRASFHHAEISLSCTLIVLFRSQGCLNLCLYYISFM